MIRRVVEREYDGIKGIINEVFEGRELRFQLIYSEEYEVEAQWFDTLADAEWALDIEFTAMAEENDREWQDELDAIDDWYDPELYGDEGEIGSWE